MSDTKNTGAFLAFNKVIAEELANAVAEREPWQVKQIDAMLALETCTKWKVECDQETAEGFFACAEPYNGIPDDGLVGFAREVDRIVPRMHINEGNPNNGRRAHTWEIGNEGSRVVYLVIDRTFLPERPDKAPDSLEFTLRRIGREAGADEVDVTTDAIGRRVIRFWW